MVLPKSSLPPTACSSQATITSITNSQESLQNAHGPSVCITPHPSSNNKLSNNQSISCLECDKLRKNNVPHIHILLDAQVTQQYQMCHLDGSFGRIDILAQTIQQLSQGKLSQDNCHKDNCHKDNCLDIVCVGEEWHRRQRLRLFCRNRRKMELLIYLLRIILMGG
jgi:hypothetical protein